MAFMSNDAAPASRVGVDANVSGSSVDQLFLKVFSGEILTAFETATVMKSLHTIRTLKSGKSATFPVTGIADSAYHTVGESIVENGTSYLSDIGKTEKQIFIDDMLLSSTFLANVDELKNHYDIRSIYAAELGKALAKRFDIATMKTLWAASNTDANLSGTTAGGSVLSGSNLDDADKVITALFEIATRLDENDAPSEGRFAIVTPKTYYKLLTADNVAINKDTGTGGNVNSGTIVEVAGIRLVKSNHLKDIAELGDLSTAATDGTVKDSELAVKNDVLGTSGVGYNSDFTKLKNAGSDASSTNDDTYGILAGTPQAIGTVKLLDLATESEYQIERQGTLFIAKYMMGHGVLRPECAVSYKVTT